jgi:hypothetical protein
VLEKPLPDRRGQVRRLIRIEPREFVAGSSAAHAAIIGGLVMWIFLHFFPIGWPQLNAVYEHGPAWARSQAF